MKSIKKIRRWNLSSNQKRSSSGTSTNREFTRMELFNAMGEYLWENLGSIFYFLSVLVNAVLFSILLAYLIINVNSSKTGVR